jgi:hypothetical protein
MKIFRSHQILQFVFAFLLALCLNQGMPANAQIPEGSINVFQVDLSAFPKISFFMEATDPEGQPIADISAGNVQIKEDNNSPIAASSISSEEPGIQVILAYNLGPALSNSAASGGTRYQAVNETFADWAAALPEDTPDDFSLATNTGLQTIRTGDPQAFAEKLRSFDPQLGDNQPNLTSLLQALDLATDPNPNPLMKRVIFYVTPQLNATNISTVTGLIERAVQQDVLVFVWLVGPAGVEASNPTVVEPLKEISRQTGGQFFIYSGEGSPPDPEDYLQALRSLYKVEYVSALNQRGSHRLSASLRQGATVISSNSAEFNLEISAPNIVILDPIFRLERTWSTNKIDTQESFLTPNQVSLGFLVEFPDGIQRDIVASRLYENQELVKEEVSGPFDQLTWDISKFESSQVVELVLEVEDSLGLVTQSIPINVEIDVAEKPLSFWQALVQLKLTPERWIILASVLTTGFVLVLAVVLAGKNRDFWRRNSAARERRTDPLTQPVAVRQEISRLGSAGHSTYPQVSGQEVAAWLVPLNDGFEALRAKAIPLTRQELIIGKDSLQSGLVIPSAAISDVHARLTRDNKGDFWLADNNSVAGTWVNYAPLSSQGTRLRHGDLVHFARNVYRFELTAPPSDREPQLITYNKDYDSRS